MSTDLKNSPKYQNPILFLTEPQLCLILETNGLPASLAKRLARTIAASLNDLETIMIQAETRIADGVMNLLSQECTQIAMSRIISSAPYVTEPFTPVEEIVADLFQKLAHQVHNKNEDADMHTEHSLRSLLRAEYAAGTSRNNVLYLTPKMRVH